MPLHWITLVPYSGLFSRGEVQKSPRALKHLEGKIFTNDNQIMKFMKLFPTRKNPLYDIFNLICNIVKPYTQLNGISYQHNV